MAGLMDFLSSDDAQLGLGLLAAGGPSATPMSLGQRLSAGVAQAQASKDAALRRQLLQSQIAENTSQDALRKAQLERQARQDAYYLGNGFAGASSAAAPGAAPGGGLAGGAAPTGGLLGSGGPAPAAAGGAAAGAANPEAGAALKAAAGAPPNAPPPAQGKFAEWSQQFKIPVDALVADYFSNGGKGIADMLFKRGTPDVQVTNGYAYDKNKQQPGYLPQLNISSNGQATQVQIGPDGQPVVSAPQGAVGTYGAYQNAQGQAAANWQEGTPVYNAQGQKVIPSRADLLNSSRAPAPVLPGRPLGATGPGYAGGSASAASGGQAEILTAELQRATQEMAVAQQRGDAAGAARAQQDVAGIQRELQRLPGAARSATAPLIGPGAGAGRGSMGMPGTPIVSAGNVVELSPQQQAINDAQKAAASSMANQTGGMLKESADQAMSAVQAVGSAQRIQQAIDSNKTLTGPGASLRLRGMQIADTLGIPGKDDSERLANTRVAMQEMAKLTIAGRKTMSGQGAITDKESALAERASSGDIDGLTPGEIKLLAAAAERSARFQYEQHQNKLGELQANPATASQVGMFKVPPLPSASTAAPSGKQISRTGTLNGRRVVQYSDGSTAYAD